MAMDPSSLLSLTLFSELMKDDIQRQFWLLLPSDAVEYQSGRIKTATTRREQKDANLSESPRNTFQEVQ